MSDAGRILERDAGGVARLTIGRPAKSNARSAELLTDLARRLRRLGARQELDLLALQGAGPKGFSAGPDVAEFASSAEALRRQLEALVEVMSALQGAIPRYCLLPILPPRQNGGWPTMRPVQRLCVARGRCGRGRNCLPRCGGRARCSSPITRIRVPRRCCKAL